MADDFGGIDLDLWFVIGFSGGGLVLLTGIICMVWRGGCEAGGAVERRPPSPGAPTAGEEADEEAGGGTWFIRGEGESNEGSDGGADVGNPIAGVGNPIQEPGGDPRLFTDDASREPDVPAAEAAADEVYYARPIPIPNAD
jgi:hypothetical protein